MGDPVVCPFREASYLSSTAKFTFRNPNGITIPKDVRELAYVMQIDIVIVSTAKENYLSYNSIPPSGFYGYATLVQRDMLLPEIPVTMPRQTLYYGRIPEAFQSWQALIDFDTTKAYFDTNTQNLLTVASALIPNTEFTPYCCSLPDRIWEELPIREVYFAPPFGTQYRFEITWTSPDEFTDHCGKNHNGKSKDIDLPKDSGLPPNGSMPSVAENPANPFSKLPPPSTAEQLGNWANPKAGTAGEADPANAPNEPETGRYRFSGMGACPAAGVALGYIPYSQIATGTKAEWRFSKKGTPPCENVDFYEAYIDDALVFPAGYFLSEINTEYLGV